MYLAVSAAVIVITAVPVKFFAIVISPLLFTFTDLLFDEYVSFALSFTVAWIFTFCSFAETVFVILDDLITLFFFTCKIVNETLTVPVYLPIPVIITVAVPTLILSEYVIV